MSFLFPKVENSKPFSWHADGFLHKQNLENWGANNFIKLVWHFLAKVPRDGGRKFHPGISMCNTNFSLGDI